MLRKWNNRNTISPQKSNPGLVEMKETFQSANDFHASYVRSESLHSTNSSSCLLPSIVRFPMTLPFIQFGAKYLIVTPSTPSSKWSPRNVLVTFFLIKLFRRFGRFAISSPLKLNCSPGTDLIAGTQACSSFLASVGSESAE